MKYSHLTVIAIVIISAPLVAMEPTGIDGTWHIPDEDFLYFVGDISTSHYSDPVFLRDSVPWLPEDDVEGEVLDRVPVYWKRLVVSGSILDRVPSPVFVVESFGTPVTVLSHGAVDTSWESVANRLSYRFVPLSNPVRGDSVYLRVESNPYAGEESYLVNAPQIDAARAGLPTMYIRAELPRTFLGFLAAVVGLGMIVLYLFRIRKGETSLLWFGLFSVLVSIYAVFEGNSINTLFDIAPKADFYLALIAADLAPIFLVAFYRVFNGGKWRQIFLVLYLLQSIVALLRLLVIITGFFPEWSDLLSLLSPVVLYLVTAAHCVAFRRSTPYSAFFETAFAILGVSYLIQYGLELVDGNPDAVFAVGSAIFFAILAAVPIYSFFRQQAHIRDQNIAFRRFVPREFLAAISRDDGTTVALGDQVERHLTILFSDIRSFTTISERLSPKENIDFVNRYLAMMGPVVRQFGGFVDKYIGDAIMALFLDDPVDAVRCAKAMLEELEAFNTTVREPSFPEIRIGIGIHSGRTMLGIVGEAERYQGTVISDAVNLASRLESLTKNVGVPILMSEVTHQLLGSRVATRYVGKTKAKGKSESTFLYTLDWKPESRRHYN